MADKRLFEQPIEIPANQGMEKRIAFGRTGVATKNMTFNDLISWLNSKLSFLRPSQNLNDVQNKATARNNLNVYSKDEVYNKSEVDTTINTLQNRNRGFTIIEMGYIKMGASNNLTYETVTWNIPIDVTRLEVGRYKYTHNLDTWEHQIIAMIDMPSECAGNSAAALKVGQISRFENYDIIYTSDDSSRNDLVNGQNIFVMLISFYDIQG